MSPQLKMLLWKEWKQRRWQLCACCAWIALAVASGVFGQDGVLGKHGIASRWAGLTMIYGFWMPIFIAMRTALGERTDRSGSFSLGLPATAQRQGSIRLLGGWLVLVVPLIVGALIVAWAAPREPVDWSRITWIRLENSVPQIGIWMADAAWRASWLYLVLCLLGTWIRTEFHLGVVGAVAALLVWVLEVYQPLMLHRDGVFYAIGLSSATLGPSVAKFFYVLGSYPLVTDGVAITGATVLTRAGALFVNLLLQGAAAVLFVRRYSQPRNTAAPGRWQWLSINLPRSLRIHGLPTPTAALAWLTLRQSLPLCLPGLVLACLLGAFLGSLQIPPADTEVSLGSIFVMTSGMIAILWAVVVGAGIFSEEIDPRTGESWRAWPLPMRRFFAVKYLVGLAVVLVVLDGPALLTVAGFDPWLGWAALACMVPLHAALYSLAVAATCLLRRSTLGAVAAIGTYLLVIFVLEATRIAHQYEPTQIIRDFAVGQAPNYPLVLLIMIATTVVSAVVGYRGLLRYHPGPSRRLQHLPLSSPAP